MDSLQRIETVTAFLNSIGNLEFDEAGRRLSEDAVMELPFVDGLAPLRCRAAITERLRQTIPAMFTRMNFTFNEWYPVAESDALLAEYTSECPMKNSDAVYTNTYIAVFRFQGNEISLYREYLNPIRMMAAVAPTA